MDDAVTKFTCFEKYLCGQTGQSLTNNVRDMALLELAFQCIDAVALAFTVADEGGLKKNSDLYGLFTLLVSVPTLAVGECCSGTSCAATRTRTSSAVSTCGAC